MVLIKDIAKKCNVSVATVSKALNNQSDIGKATRERILRVADEMGYTANASARALKTNRTYNLGVLFDDVHSTSIAHEFFSMILESFKREAESKGYDITFINRHVANQRMSFLKHSLFRNFDGVIIITADFGSAEILELVNSEIPVVTIDHIFKNASAVISDNRTGLYTLTRFAIEKGHRKIAYIHGEDTGVTRDRISGFFSALREYKVEVPESFVVESKYHNTEKCEEITRKILSGSDKPTCILFPDDYSALGGMKAIESLNFIVNKDISIIGYDGINLADIFGLTTYKQNTENLGRIACDKLVDQIEVRDREVEHVIVSGEFVEGKFSEITVEN